MGAFKKVATVCAFRAIGQDERQQSNRKGVSQWRKENQDARKGQPEETGARKQGRANRQEGWKHARRGRSAVLMSRKVDEQDG